MKKQLKTLIKLEKRRLDALRREQGQLQQQKAILEHTSELLLQDLKNEVTLAAKLADLGSFFGNFSEHIKKKREQIARDVHQIDRKMAVLADKITIVYSEQKKYEVALDNLFKREKKERERREQLELDEIAGQRHRPGS